jgi:hypothetical protein
MDERDDALSILILMTGPLALVVSTGWQVAWLVLLAVFAVLRRRGAGLPGAPRSTSSPPDPAGA